MIKEVFDTIERFLNDEYDALDFSFEFPEFLITAYDEIDKENAEVNNILNDNIPEICADYEMGQPADEFKEKIKTEYKKCRDAMKIS